jgi:hypothetical protein
MTAGTTPDRRRRIMIKRPIPAGGHAHGSTRAAPLTGIVVGSAISLVLWALMLAIVFAIR